MIETMLTFALYTCAGAAAILLVIKGARSLSYWKEHDRLTDKWWSIIGRIQALSKVETLEACDQQDVLMEEVKAIRKELEAL